MRSANEMKVGESQKTAISEPSASKTVSRHASASSEVSILAAGAHASGIAGVPSHAVGRVNERRAYIRARLSLPMRVQRIAGQRDSKLHSLHTRDISSSGVFFLYPQQLDPGTPIELEVLLVDRPAGRGSVRMCTLAHVVRSQDSGKPGWHGLAAIFDDISFVRDDHDPLS